MPSECWKHKVSMLLRFDANGHKRWVCPKCEPQPQAPEETYAQRVANETGKPYYVGPDNVNGGSHWVYPQAAPSTKDKP